MDSARWQRIESICFDALELQPSGRSEFLKSACDNDLELLHEVESLLAQLQRDPGFLERPVVDLSPSEEDPDLSTWSSTSVIGPYRLERRLGRGGMGEVYLAVREAEDTQRTVALKVVRSGRNTRDVLRRFRLERRILAGLHHPNISAFLDAAATPDGRPYFVMEYVDGLPIDRYCDQKRLTVRERLEIFAVVCRAVQHAHQNLVVHRDLKPRNILVTEEGVPKLLDFGIGKVLTPGAWGGETGETATAVRVLTPEYAAPEQIEGGDITTATDVYGLGVLLYELLAGRHPFVSAGETVRQLERAVLEGTTRAPSAALSRRVLRPGESETSDSTAATAQMIAERRTTTPAHLRRQLSGDLDTIVLKAVHREPERRYGSSAALADDIQRYLQGLPVSARPDTLAYRARKFARRHAGWVAAAAVAFVSLGATTVVTLIQSRRLAAESARVAAERDKALEVRSFLMEMFGASGADRTVGDTLSVRRLLDLQAATVDAVYGDRPELQADMKEVLADGYDRLGLYQAAEPLAHEALDLRRRTLAPGHPDVASALNTYGWIVHELGRSKEAEPLLQEAVQIRRADGPSQSLDLARSLNDLGSVLTTLTRYDEAQAVLEESLSIRRAQLGDEHRAVAITASNLAAVHYFRGRLEEAVRIQQLAIQALEKSVGRNHQRTTIALGNLAAFRRSLGEWDEAVAVYRDLLERQSQLQGRTHPVTVRVVASLATVLQQRGAQLEDSASLKESEALYREAIDGFRATLGSSHETVGVFMSRLAANESSLGKQQDALRTVQQALAILRATSGENHQNTALALGHLATIRRRMGQLPAAIETQRQAVAALEKSLGPENAETGGAKGALCDHLLAAGEVEEAGSVCAIAARVLESGNPAQRQAVPLVQLHLAQVHLAQGQKSAADSLIAAARPALEGRYTSAEARRLLASVTARAGG